MSMLAERKRKQKWSLNPRGKAWSEDVNKFGQRMLEKMGWQHGKGLGANENGVIEHVKISYKNDSQGMGFKETNDQWTEHETNFTALLQTLGDGDGKNEGDLKLKSLEEKSQTSRVRVHYHKFTRGKDLSRYSEKDLANIFGKRNLKVVKVKDEEPEQKSVEDPSPQNKFLYNGGSMKDYFKKKIPNFGKSNGYIIGNNGVLKRDESDSEEHQPAFGFGFKLEQEKEETVPTKSTFVSYINGSNKRKADELVDHNIFSPRKKVKKGRNKESENQGCTNPAFNPMSTPVKVIKHVLDVIEEHSLEESVNSTENVDVKEIYKDSLQEKTELKEKKKKKVEVKDVIYEENKENGPDDNAGITNPLFDQSIDVSINSLESKIDNNCYEVKIKTKKKRMKSEDVVSRDICSESGVENQYEVKNKNKKIRNNVEDNNSSAGISNPLFEDCTRLEVTMEISDNPYEVKPKKKKKKKKDLGINNPVFADNDLITDIHPSINYVEEVTQNKIKKKKKQHLLNEVPILQDSDFVQSETKNKKKSQKQFANGDDDSECSQEKQKKKKKKKVNNDIDLEKGSTDVHQNIGLNNSNMNSSQSDVISLDNCDLMLNITNEPPPVKTPIIGGSETKKLVNKRRKSVRFSDITEEHIIPNNEEIKRMESEYNSGIDNVNFDTIQTHVNENIDTISKQIDMYQAEIENDMNEKKQITLEDIMIGEIGNDHGENEKLPIGTKLKFKYANFQARTPKYHLDKTGPKKSYKHLIKGDIILKFNDTNLHEIKGYATDSKRVGGK